MPAPEGLGVSQRIAIDLADPGLNGRRNRWTESAATATRGREGRDHARIGGTGSPP